MANYYCLMAGLPEIRLSDTKPGYDMDELTEQLHESLTDRDASLMADYFFLQRDCRNLVALLKNPDAEVKLDGNYTQEQYLDLITSAREMNFNVHRYPSFLSEFARHWAFNKDVKGYFPEDEILYSFYAYAIKTCRNGFVRRWYQLNMDVNNILTALLARRQGWNVADYVKGDGEVQDEIREHSSKDFIQSLDIDNVESLKQIVEQTDPVQKEKMIDAFKWRWLDEETMMEPFSIDSVFAYMCKLEMQYRWARLDVEQGKEYFRQIIDNLRGEARVPEEFRHQGVAQKDSIL